MFGEGEGNERGLRPLSLRTPLKDGKKKVLYDASNQRRLMSEVNL
jgi:hypothetical protein